MLQRRSFQLVFVGSLVLAACGGSSGGSTSSTTASSSTTAGAGGTGGAGGASTAGTGGAGGATTSGSGGAGGAGGSMTTTSGGAMCTPGASIICYTGPAGTNNVGACHPGKQVCLSDGMSYGPCTGQTLPAAEMCPNGIDEDCNNVVDDC